MFITGLLIIAKIMPRQGQMQTQGNVSACLSLQGNPSPIRTAVGDSVLRACGSVLSRNPCNSHLTLEDMEACRGSLPAVSQLPGSQTLPGSAPQRGLLVTTTRELGADCRPCAGWAPCLWQGRRGQFGDALGLPWVLSWAGPPAIWATIQKGNRAT